MCGEHVPYMSTNSIKNTELDVTVVLLFSKTVSL